MQRVAIFGSPGSGKSTLARRLSARTGLPAFYFDRYFFGPNWVIRSDEEFRSSMTAIVAENRWITDGNYLNESILTGRIDRADTLILLDVPRVVCLWRVVRRIIKHYGQVRPDQAEGCAERVDWPFLQFVWSYPSRMPRIQQLLSTQIVTKTVLVLRSETDIDNFLRNAAVDTSLSA